MIPLDWTPYVRPEDEELIGYLVPSGDGVVPVTLFGYPLADAQDASTALAVLRARGLACLADQWVLAVDGRDVEVKILSAYRDRVELVATEYGYFGPWSARYTVGIPDDGRLRPRTV